MRFELLIADFGRLYTVSTPGSGVYFGILRELSVADWVKSVVCTTVRIAFLLRIGLLSIKDSG